MRIYGNCYELMSELSRNLFEMGIKVTPKTYQNKKIENKDDFITKELICEQYCLLTLDEEDALFVFDKRSKDWTRQEYLERIMAKVSNPGTAWELRKDLWEQFLDSEGKFDYTYSERMQYVADTAYTNNLDCVIKTLREDTDTRKAVLPIFGLGDVCYAPTAAKRIPCSMYYNFLIRANAKGEKVLHIMYHQRSADFVEHFGNDVWLAWKLRWYVAKRLGIQEGYLYHTIDSLHSYKKDWNKLKTPIKELL